MDTTQLISEVKARFGHNSAKAYLKDKYDSRLLVANQGGLWKATPELMGYLASRDDQSVILVDTFGNPIMVNRIELYNLLCEAYEDNMAAWYLEWKELENKR